MTSSTAVQEDIAGEVAKALRVSIESTDERKKGG
jgi:hypothetical protein